MGKIKETLVKDMCQKPVVNDRLTRWGCFKNLNNKNMNMNKNKNKVRKLEKEKKKNGKIKIWKKLILDLNILLTLQN